MVEPQINESLKPVQQGCCCSSKKTEKKHVKNESSCCMKKEKAESCANNSDKTVERGTGYGDFASKDSGGVFGSQ